MKRRVWVLCGIGALAATGGFGLASWQRRQERQAVAAAMRSPADPGAAGLWGQRFARPGGGELPMSGLRGRPLLLNFWATWCPPCVKELPLLDAFQRKRRSSGWQVAGLAVDSPGPVEAFLVRKPVSFDIGIVGMDGVALSRELGNRSGQLPFSVLFDRSGAIRQRRLGPIDDALLAGWWEEIG